MLGPLPLGERTRKPPVTGEVLGLGDALLHTPGM